jgi:hypothetical protein
MNAEKKLNIVKILYSIVLLPLVILVFVKSGSLIVLTGIIAMFGFIFLWLWQWRRCLEMRTEFLDLASRFEYLSGDEREKARHRLLELASFNCVEARELSSAFGIAEVPEDDDSTC